MSVGMQTVVSYLPDEIVTRDAFQYLQPYMPDFDDQPEERRRLRQKDAVEIMACEVARKALDDAGVEATDIDLIIAQSTGGQYVMPGIAAHIHHELGFPETSPAWNTQECCGSFVDSCYMGWNMLIARPEMKRVLVVVSCAWETGAWGMDATSVTAPSCGDGAAAAILATEDLKCEFLSYAARTYGEIYPYLVTENGPAEHPELLEALEHPQPWAFMRASDRFAEFVGGKGKMLPVELIPDALEKAGLSIDDLDVIVPHQVFKMFNDLWIEESAKIGIPRDIWHLTWDKYGNVAGVDVPITLSELVEGGKIETDAIVALFSPGASGHSPTLIARWR